MFSFEDLIINSKAPKYYNMKFGKTIKIFLIDGDSNGRMTCELSNWTGKAYKIPRIKIKAVSYTHLTLPTKRIV